MAKEPKFKLLQTVVPIETWRGLEEMAAQAGEEISDTAEKLLSAIVEDDRAAHQAGIGGTAACPSYRARQEGA